MYRYGLKIEGIGTDKYMYKYKSISNPLTQERFR